MLMDGVVAPSTKLIAFVIAAVAQAAVSVQFPSLQTSKCGCMLLLAPALKLSKLHDRSLVLLPSGGTHTWQTLMFHVCQNGLSIRSHLYIPCQFQLGSTLTWQGVIL